MNWQLVLIFCAIVWGPILLLVGFACLLQRRIQGGE